MKENLFKIATTTYSRAILVQSILESEGFECYLSNVNLIQPLISSEVNVNIRESDVEQCISLVASLLKKHGSEKEKALIKLRKIRRILVPVDFSGSTTSIVSFALRLAEKFKAEIMLQHVFFIAPLNEASLEGTLIYSQGAYSSDQILESDARSKTEKLAKEIKLSIKEQNISGVRIKWQVQLGTPAESILHYCESYQPGIIVMGTHGGGQSFESIFGSTTHRVVREASVPVLAIPENLNEKAFGTFNSILYSTDFEEFDFKAIRKLINICSPFNAKIFCTHFDCEDTNPVDKFKMEELKNYFINEFPNQNFNFDIILCKELVSGIQEYTEKHNINIISLTTHKRNVFMRWLIPSVTKKILFNTKIPLLVFHHDLNFR